MLAKWWDKYEHCKKCLLWVDMGADDIDAYKGCLKQNKRDYEISECPLTEEQYKFLTK